ncbi:HEAT repeat domain-containing protein [Polyangium aurulentum]|nr:HEAT repeat domain-containing protein [Polyangium aurulentum]
MSKTAESVCATSANLAPVEGNSTPPSRSCTLKRRMQKSALLLLLAAMGSTGLVPRIAQADPRTGYLVQQLKTSDDFKVRTQAALALGASGDDAAVKPLCEALTDSNASVKAAAAAALGKLGKPAGLPCLQSAIGKEGPGSTKSQMQKSIDTLKSGGGVAAPPPPGPDAKYYVAIEVTNKTSRPAGEIEAIVRGAMQKKLLGKAGYAVAPKGETSAQGGKVVKGKNLKGYFLIATVEPPVYEGGNLTQVVRVSMWTYPGKALQGEFSPKLTQSGTSKGDTESENILMKMCVENAIDTFSKVAASM